MQIKAVIFDLDHTLYDFMTCHNKANEAVCKYAKEHFDMPYDKTDRLVTKAMYDVADIIGHDNPATHSRVLRMKLMLETIGEDAIEHTVPMADAYWNTFYEHIKLLPEVEDVLSLLKEKGIKILICTDMQVDVQIAKLKRTGIDKYVDFLVTSEEANCEKPGDAILDMCVRKAGCDAAECVFIGDHPKKDVLGPMAYGMQAVWCKQFDTDAFMNAYDIKVDDTELKRIEHVFDDYSKCIIEGDKIDFGGIIL